MNHFREFLVAVAVALASASFTIGLAHAQGNQIDLKSSVIEKALTTVYQPRHNKFAIASAKFLDAAKRSCEQRTEDSFYELRDQFASVIVAFAAIELYRAGPALDDNRQNRLFYWPDNRLAGERQLQALLELQASDRTNVYELAEKSVTVQGFPALERLLFGKDAQARFAVDSDEPDCQLAIVIAKNISSMADALSAGWGSRSEFVESMVNRVVNSNYFRTEEEVLGSMLNQSITGMEDLQNQKIAPLTGDDGQLKNAPLWLSEQTMPMIKANVDSVRSLLIDSGLAAMTSLEDELKFEFRTADTMLQALVELPDLTDESGELTTKARSLIRSMAAVTGGIVETLNGRFSNSLLISVELDSEQH